jgi:esterase FrsA
MKWILLLLITGTITGTFNDTFASEISDAWGAYITGGMIADGVEKHEATRSFNRIETLDPMATGPGSWVYELNYPGDVHLEEAHRHELNGKPEGALTSYKRAMAYFNAARFPATYTPERKRAYQKQLVAYRKVSKLAGFPLELISIPFEGKEIKVHFHNRNDFTQSSGPQPVLIWSGGLDGWKTGGMDFKKELMSTGFSVLAIDLPGTGESEWLLEPDSDRIYGEVVSYLKTRDDVDADRIAVYFGSFSGVYAIKMALTNPDIAAAVNHSGGIHLFFNPQIEQLPPLTTTMGMRATATTYVMGVFNEELDAIRKRLATFSLKTQGLLKATPDQAPLLSIYGTADRLMPIQDLDVLMESGVKSDNLVYKGDHHMAWEHADDHQSKMITWLKKQLDM